MEKFPKIGMKKCPTFMAYAVGLSVALLLALLLGLPYVDMFPSYIHAWAQADWYSIAIGFQQNGYDFFHPETLIYNKQFPGTWAVDYGDTVTSVDFPVHAYIAALLMRLSGTSAPWVFRLWTLLCSIVGMCFFYLLCKRLTDSVWKSVLALMLCMTAPVYAYYVSNFLPCAPALALSCIGLWAYVRYYQENDGRLRYWNLGVGMLALATLIRTSFAVALLALLGFELLRILCKDTSLGKKWVMPLAGALAVMGYYWWNRHLSGLHGTLFLGNLTPPRDMNDVHEVFDHINYSWKWQYFTRLQHWVIALSLIASVILALVRRIRHGKPAEKRLHRISLLWLAVIWLFGAFCFFVAMMRQYVDHDYYFLDSLFLPLLLVFVLALTQLPQWRHPVVLGVLSVGLFLLGGVMYNEAKHSNRHRCSGEDRASLTAERFQGSEQWLDSLGVASDAKVCSFLSYPQNTPFLKMGRKGYALMFYDDYIVERMLAFDFDYIIMENEVYAANLEEHGDVLSLFRPVATNGKLTLYTLYTENAEEQ